MCANVNQTRDFTVRDEFSDVTIVVENTKLFVHRQYLAEWSGVWRKLLLAECPDDPLASIEIVLEDKTLNDVIQLLQCIYSSQSYITGELMKSALYRTALQRILGVPINQFAMSISHCTYNDKITKVLAGGINYLTLRNI